MRDTVFQQFEEEEAVILRAVLASIKDSMPDPSSTEWALFASDSTWSSSQIKHASVLAGFEMLIDHHEKTLHVLRKLIAWSFAFKREMAVEIQSLASSSRKPVEEAAEHAMIAVSELQALAEEYVNRSEGDMRIKLLKLELSKQLPIISGIVLREVYESFHDFADLLQRIGQSQSQKSQVAKGAIIALREAKDNFPITDEQIQAFAAFAADDSALAEAGMDDYYASILKSEINTSDADDYEEE